ncbi:roadblock/LC7 domain-containing protein [Dyella sp. A6]|uniref:roadblock/LC7 domain-containing protein n=1 Tax=Dyella aluminiiresistens TaxID=3069105 RepID=UPI002E762055|nr:roadblock/LC7 domain-containing protein [Dyella sp. A6]
MHEFQDMSNQVPGIALILLSTADGRAVCNWTASNIADPRRLAAMTNSFLTLGETMARELGMRSAEYATVCTPGGNMVLIRINGPTPMTLAAMDDSRAALASLLFAARNCAQRVSALIPRAA